MNFISNSIKGVLIGAGAIMPGISSGVLCVIFGIYEKLLDSILNFFNDIKENFKFLFPLVFGGLIGVFLFSNLLNYVFNSFPLQTKSIFIGLIIGCIPSLIKDIKIKCNNKFKLSYLLIFIFALSIGILSVILENYSHISYNYEDFSFFYLLICGILMSAGVVIPGISNTVILMLLGVYPIYLSSVSTLFFPVLIPLGIGLLIGGLFFMKLTKYLLSKHYIPTFFAIIGFTVGSIFVLSPNIQSFLDFTICISCICFGFLLASFHSDS